MADSASYANAWLALLPQALLPTMAVQAVARECARYADWKTGANVRPGRALLAKNLNCSTDTVKRALGTLVDYGLLRQETKGRRVGTRGQASVYQLTVPEHLATDVNLARFPDPAAVQVVTAKTRGKAKHQTSEEPEVDSPTVHGCPAENPTEWLPNRGEESEGRPAGNPTEWLPDRGRPSFPTVHGCTSQRGTGAPPPSIDPPTTSLATARGDAEDGDAAWRTPEEVTADGLRLVRQALGDRPRQGGDRR